MYWKLTKSSKIKSIPEEKQDSLPWSTPKLPSYIFPLLSVLISPEPLNHCTAWKQKLFSKMVPLIRDYIYYTIIIAYYVTVNVLLFLFLLTEKGTFMNDIVYLFFKNTSYPLSKFSDLKTGNASKASLKDKIYLQIYIDLTLKFCVCFIEAWNDSFILTQHNIQYFWIIHLISVWKFLLTK